jgi:tRNA A-37 threonylcarbamoyl transferase component Bud32
MSSIKSINTDFFCELCADNACLRSVIGKPRVFLNADGKIIKLIYPRAKLFSFSKVWPYWRRMQRNSRLLLKKKIPCPIPLEFFNYAENGCTIITYKKLPGRTVLEVAKDGNIKILKSMAQFLAKMHNLGISHRDLHLENFIVDSKKFSLIDIEACKIFHRKVNLGNRARDFANFIHWETQRSNNPLFELGIKTFLDIYLKASDMVDCAQKKFLTILEKKLLSRNVILKEFLKNK